MNQSMKWLQGLSAIVIDPVRCPDTAKAFSEYEYAVAKDGEVIPGYEARTQEYLRTVENLIGLKRGLLSDAQEVEKTAFEIASTAGDYNLSLQDLQSVWFDGVRDYLRICDSLGQMYRYCDQSAWDVTEQLAITWGNGVLYDPDKEWQQECELVRLGYLRPEIALGHRYDMPCETEEDWKAIREKYMPDANAEPLNEVERLR